MPEPIQKLRVYCAARALEDAVYERVNNLPADLAYPTGNDLRRMSAAVCHHISESHRSYSYRLKLEHLTLARQAAETIKDRLVDPALPQTECEALAKNYGAVIGQLWGLLHYLRAKRAEQTQKLSVNAIDELVASRRKEPLSR